MPSFAATVEVEFEVFCGRCGVGLCRQSSTGTTAGRGHLYVSVEPCDNCLSTARDEGYNDGFEEGKENGNP